MQNAIIKVLFVDDEKHNLLSFSANFRRNFHVYTAISAAEGRRLLENNEIPIVIADYRMPVENGIKFLSDVKEAYPHTTRILLTGYADIEAVVNAINQGGIHFYMKKPWDSQELEEAIITGFEFYRRQKDKDKRLAALDIEIQQLKGLCCSAEKEG